MKTGKKMGKDWLEFLGQSYMDTVILQSFGINGKAVWSEPSRGTCCVGISANPCRSDP